jgi:hypothetical protein
MKQPTEVPARNRNVRPPDSVTANTVTLSN